MVINLKKIGQVLLVVFLLTANAVVTEAKTVIRSGDTVSIAEDEVVEGDFYSVGAKINISGQITEDIISAGGQITINGTIEQDAFLIAARVDTHGTIGDDLRIVSGEVTIAEPVMGDLLVMAGQVNILSSASVGGDVILFAGEVVIEGSVGGSVLGKADLLRIDAPVAGDVDVRVRQLTLGDNAVVEGSVRYVSDLLAIQSLNASVAGDLVRNDPIVSGESDSPPALLLVGLIALFSILVWYLVARASLGRLVTHALTFTTRSIWLGLAAILLTPVAFGMLTVSVIGSGIGLLLAVIYFGLLLMSTIAMVAVLGSFLMQVSKKHSVVTLSLVSMLVGVVGLLLLMLLPVLGSIIIFGFVIQTFGAAVDMFIKSVVK